MSSLENETTGRCLTILSFNNNNNKKNTPTTHRLYKEIFYQANLIVCPVHETSEVEKLSSNSTYPTNVLMMSFKSYVSSSVKPSPNKEREVRPTVDNAAKMS